MGIEGLTLQIFGVPSGQSLVMCRPAVGQPSRVPPYGTFQQMHQQGWQARYPSGLNSMRAPTLEPQIPVEPTLPKDMAMPSSKRACLSRDAQPYGYVEPLSFDFCTAVHIAAYYGHWQVIRQFIESSQCDPCQLFAARNSQVCWTPCSIGHSNLPLSCRVKASTCSGTAAAFQQQAFPLHVTDALLRGLVKLLLSGLSQGCPKMRSLLVRHQTLEGKAEVRRLLGGLLPDDVLACAGVDSSAHGCPAWPHCNRAGLGEAEVCGGERSGQ